MMQTSDPYEKKISALQAEINYLHKLLDAAKIPYKEFVANISYEDDLRQAGMESDQGSRIIPINLTPKHAAYFYSIFKGRRDVYSKRGGKANTKTGKTGYFTQCWNFWKDGICPKKSGNKITCSECVNQKYKELTGKVLLEHLMGNKADGSDVIGLYAILPDETCNFLVFDFDNHDDGLLGDDGANSDDEWIHEVNAMRDICKENDVPIITERSRSGKGAHIWMFFEEAIPAYLARKFGSALLTKGAETVNLKNFNYYDRMIPTQDHLPVNIKSGKQGLGNLIALPLQGLALKYGNSAFIDEDWNAYPNQWQILASVVKIKRSFIDEKINEWCETGVLGILGDEFQNTGENSENSSEKKTKSKPWEKKPILFNEDDILGSLGITLADKVYVCIENVKPRMQNLIRRMATFSNPEFYKNMKMGFSTKGMPRIIFCGYDEDGYICLPRALHEPLIELLNKSKIKHTVKDLREEGQKLKAYFKGELYDEQQEAADKMLQYENGILGATTAFGKTVVGAYMIAERKVNTLILVHNTEILKNWVEDLEKFLYIDEELPEYTTKTGRIKKRKSIIGKLYAGHNSMTGIIDIAMFSSLGKKEEINPIVEKYGMVIMDECHHGAAQTVEDVISSVKAKFVYGLTATPKRDDGMEKKVYMQFGPVRYRYTAKERAEKQGIPHYIYPRFTRLVSTEKLKINDAYKVVTENEVRNEQIINDVIECIMAGRTPLVLSKYKSHAESLFKKLQGKVDHVFLLQGGGSRKEKDIIRKEIREVSENESVVIVATDKYIGEGFNYPRLDTMLLTMPIAWEGNVEQYAGRLHRDYKSKKNVVIYDYVDIHIRVLEKMYHKRLRTYKKIGYGICKNIIATKQQANAIYDMETYYPVYEKDLLETNNKVIISSPGINRVKVHSFIKIIQKHQERGVKFTVITLNPESYPKNRIEATKELVGMLTNAGINVRLKEYMHEHYAVIDDSIVWYGSMNLLSQIKEDDNIIRVDNKEVATELMEMSFRRKDDT